MSQFAELGGLFGRQRKSERERKRRAKEDNANKANVEEDQTLTSNADEKDPLDTMEMTELIKRRKNLFADLRGQDAPLDEPSEVSHAYLMFPCTVRFCGMTR